MGAVAVFTGSLCVMVYVLFLYPVLLGCMARRAHNPVRRAPIRPPVSIIVAVYNGEAFIEDKLRSIRALDYPREQLEVLVASDGSTDRTNSIVQSFASQGVRLLRLPR